MFATTNGIINGLLEPSCVILITAIFKLSGKPLAACFRSATPCLHPAPCRSLSQFQLPSSLFKDPELINAPERCGLALFNINTQALEGLWEATFCDAAADRVRARTWVFSAFISY